jgi:hypothetical protein
MPPDWISRGDSCHDNNGGGFSVLLTVSFQNTFVLLLVIFLWSTCFMGAGRKNNDFGNGDDDDDDPTMVDDRSCRRSGCPRLDRPVLRHADASCCRTTTSKFLPCRHRQTMGEKGSVTICD